MINPGILAATHFEVKNPKDLQGVAIWLDFTDLASVTVSSGKITSAAEKSGTGLSFTPSVAGNEGTYFNSGGAGNLPYASFAAGKNLQLTGLNIGQPFTMFYMMKSNSWGGAAVNLALQLGNTACGLNQVSQTVGANTIKMLGQCMGSNYTYPMGYTRSWRNEFALLTSGWGYNSGNTGFQGAPLLTFFQGVNDTCISRVQGSTPGPNPISQILINATTGMATDVQELVIYNRELTVKEYRAVVNYFMKKYSLPQYDFVEFWGDSITGFGGTTIDKAYTTLTAQELGFEFSSNWGIGGSTLSDNFMLNYPQSLRCSPRGWLVLNYGTNAGDYSAKGAVKWEQDYNTYIAYMIAAGWNPNKIILQSIAPGGVSNPLSYAPAMRDIVQRVATKNNTRFCDQYTYLTTGTRQSESYGSDYLHPWDQGHRYMADNLKLSFA